MSPTPTTTRSVRPALLLPMVLLVLVLLAACGPSGDAAGEDADADAAAVPADPPAEEAAESVPPAGAAEGFEPVTSRSSGASADSGGTVLAAEGPAAEGEPIQAPGVTFRLPADWQQEPPASNMRLAQAAIPSPEGSDAGDAQLTVFYFGPGGGGGTDANLDRWVGQVEVDPSTPPKRVVTDLGSGLRAHWVEVQGTLQPSMMGTGPTEPTPDSTLLGAVVEGPQGPWFFKATGPTETLDAEREAFFAMLRSLEPTA